MYVYIYIYIHMYMRRGWSLRRRPPRGREHLHWRARTRGKKESGLDTGRNTLDVDVWWCGSRGHLCRPTLCLSTASRGQTNRVLRLSASWRRIREMGGTPKSPAPRNHFWCGLSNHKAATEQMHLVGKNIVECRPLLGALPLSLKEDNILFRSSTDSRSTDVEWSSLTVAIVYYVCVVVYVCLDVWALWP